MGRLIARRSSEVPWQANRATKVDGKDQTLLRSKLYLNPARDPAMLRLVEYMPGYTEPRHRHMAAEIVYVVSGSVDIDGTLYEAGDALWIDAHTEYGPLTAGPQGMTFLLIRQGPADLIPGEPGPAR